MVEVMCGGTHFVTSATRTDFKTETPFFIKHFALCIQQPYINVTAAISLAELIHQLV
jgi:hypothetical protein